LSQPIDRKEVLSYKFIPVQHAPDSQPRWRLTMGTAMKEERMETYPAAFRELLKGHVQDRETERE
jgi:hypothetical protein